MVTCVDVCGYNVMTGSLDGTVALWDLRKSDEATQTIFAQCAAGNESVSTAQHNSAGKQTNSDFGWLVVSELPILLAPVTMRCC